MALQLKYGTAVDLTHTISQKMTIYVGDPSPKITRVKKLGRDGVNLSKLELGSHTGTHIDAPFHFIKGGKTVDELEADSFCGQAIVLDFSKKKPGEGIGAKDLERFKALTMENDIVLLYTGMSTFWGKEWARRRFTYLSPEGASWLVRHKVKAVGIDYLSIEEFGSKKNETHKTLLGNGVLIIESLNSNLKTLVGKRIALVCLPIKTKGTDGAPARAIAYLSTDGSKS